MKPFKERDQTEFVDHGQQDLLNQADEILLEEINHPRARFAREAGPAPPSGVLVRVRLAPMSALLGYVQVRALWGESEPAPSSWRSAAQPRQPRTGWITKAAPPAAGKA